MARDKFIRNLKYLKKGGTDAIEPEIDDIRSAFPSNVVDGGGFLNLSTSTYLDSIIAAISTRYFVLQGIFVKNAETRNHNIVLYDGNSASVGKATALGFQVLGSTNEYIVGLKWPFHSGVYANIPTSILGSAGQVEIRVQGILIASNT